MKKNLLSEIEKSFYYQAKLNPEDDSGNIIHKVTFDHSIGPDDIGRMLGVIMSSHQSLRYSLREEDGVPYFLDSNLAQAEECASLLQLRRPFDLSRDTLLRFFIDGGEVYIASHHIIFDDVSWKVFIRDLSQLLKNDYQDLPKSTRNQSEHSKINSDDLAYWVDRLSGTEHLVNIQKSNNPTSKRSTEIISYQLRRSVSDDLRIYAKSKKVSLNTVFMYAVAIVLYRLTEQGEMVISTPISTREFGDDDIYCGINVLPCLIGISGNAVIEDGLLEFSNAMWGSIEKRNFSLLELTRTLVKDRTEGLYNVMVEYVQKYDAPGVVSDDIVKNESPKLDIVVSAEGTGDDIAVSIEYDTARVDGIFADAIPSRIERVLSCIMSGDDMRVSDIELNDPLEIKELLSLGQGKIVGLTDQSIIDRFREHALANGDLVAVRHNDDECSYGELLKSAERIASHLIDAGVSPQDKVGIYMERSIEYVSAMFAIWMLNAVYVPLDVNNPHERNKFFVERADIKVVIANRATLDFSECAVVNVAELHKEYNEVMFSPIGLDDIAYVIFTSGSTGTPKGIAIRHDGFINHLDIMIDELSLTKKDVIAQTAPASFDISVWQLTCALVVGAAIEICGQDVLIDVDTMYGKISTNGISVLEVVPSLLSAYLDAENRSNSLLAGLGQVKVITTGEAITNDIAEKWVKQYPGKSLINAYGPAEASDDTHFYDINNDSVNKYASVPVGRALRNIRTYILDADQKLSPRGVIGEVAIGGVAVADGYVGDEARTRAVFAEDDFVGAGRLYRTGDYGMWLPDGNLAYNGRRDNQIKIRGQRFELGEIENALKDIAEVGDAAAIIYDYESNRRIVGFASTDQDYDCDEDTLKAKLAKSLPSYMIPWRVIIIPTIPRNNNGKIDREGLANIAKNLNNEQGVVEDDGLLSVICEVYSTVLGCSVDANTNYFDAGGDSLLSIKVVSRLRERGVVVSVRDVIINQTPVELAKVAESLEASGEDVDIPDGYMSAIQKRYIVEAGRFADYGEIQAAILKDPRLHSNNISEVIEKINVAYPQFGMAEMAAIREVQSYDEVTAIIEEFRTKLKLHERMAISMPIKIGAELGILFIIHHYIFDVYSWNILHQDMKLLLDGKRISNKSDTRLLQCFARQNIEIPSYDKNDHTGTHETSRHFLQVPFAHATGLASDSLLLVYAVAKAIMQERGESSLSFGIERSVRIDSKDFDLSDSIGWATYIEQKYVYDSDDFGSFKERYQSESGNDWNENIDVVINYLGGVVSSSDDRQIIGAPIYREASFIEIDIELGDGAVSYHCQENIGLKNEDLKKISADIEGILEEYTSGNSLDELQQFNILERVKFRAERD